MGVGLSPQKSPPFLSFVGPKSSPLPAYMLGTPEILMDFLLMLSTQSIQNKTTHFEKNV